MKGITVLLFSLLVLGCSKEVQRDTLTNFGDLIEPKIIHADTLDFEHSSKVVGIAANADYLYVLGEDSSVIHRFDHDFNLISTHLLHGRGPGEIANPDMVSVSDNRVLIVDDDDNTVQIYDTDLVHLQSFSMNGIINSLDVIGNDFFLVSFVELGQSRIELYDAKLLKSFTIKSASDHPLDIIGIASFLDPENFYFVRRYTNQVFIVNIKSSEVKELRNPFMMEKVDTEKKMNIIVPSYQVTLQTASSSDGLYALAGIILEEGLPLFRYNDTGTVDKIWVFDKESQIQRISVYDKTLFGYSFVNNTLSKYEL